MLSKLLKKDLKRNMRWLWILFVCTIVVAFITRGVKELGENIMFFKVIGIFFDSVFYALAVNVILQPFLKNFLNFSKSFYGDSKTGRAIEKHVVESFSAYFSAFNIYLKV